MPRELDDHLEESLLLAKMAGYSVVRTWRTRYRRRVGRGLMEEIGRATKQDNPSTLIFYGEIQPSSAFQLMKSSRLRVIDRVMLILEIFIRHAGTREAQLQIEMAKIKHEIPLVREWLRRSKLGELPGFLGPGGYAIDGYYRHLTSRLARIRRELEDLRRQRVSRMTARRESGIPHVAIVGYASAGKTSLFNSLTGESRKVGEEYFTTLQPKHTATDIRGRKIVMIDTIGFIRDVPPEIVEAFHVVLEEIKYSDLVLFVVDISERWEVVKEKVAAGLLTLSKIGALDKPLVLAANKVDKAEAVEEKVAGLRQLLQAVRQGSPIVSISALTGHGMEELKDAIITSLGLERGEAVERLQPL
ncbi:MAG: GTPase HflX [Acidilobaceae archaeon]|nr:GTPase HflX [Acidilobaceae archaeon]MCX8165708.1 GTPase HflX [Acidilobaceae archaeon]